MDLDNKVIEKVYDSLVQFCSRIGGKFVYPESPDKLDLRGEFVCEVPRMDNRRLSEIIAKDMLNILPDLRVLEDRASEFPRIRIREPNRITTVYANGFTTITIEDHKTFDIDPRRVGYVYIYPHGTRAVTQDSIASINIVTGGYSDEKYRAWVIGTIIFRQSIPFHDAEKHIEDKLNEIEAMIKEILDNPKNFFEFGSKE